MEIKKHTLDNGLKIAHAKVPGDVTYCGIAIAAGTRDENEDEQGMAHFVEHTIFKGTKRRKAWHILNRMEKVGGDLNAYTNKEETVIYSALLNRDMERAVELLCDIVFNSVFPQKELDKEKEVILDEIDSYEDSPSELIFDDFEELIFKGHPLGKNILGTPEKLKGYTTGDALRFVSRLYKPNNMVLFARGNTDFGKLVRLAEKYATHIPAGEIKRHGLEIPGYRPTTFRAQRNVHQTHIMIGTRGYNAYEDRRIPLYMISNMLGGPGMNSRLNVELREKRGLVYNVEANITSYTDTGVFSIYTATTPKDTDRCREIILKELKKMREQKMSVTALESVKKQLIGQICVASDNNENCALDMGKCILHYDEYDNKESLLSKIRAISAEDILETANERLREEQLTTLIYDAQNE